MFRCFAIITATVAAIFALTGAAAAVAQAEVYTDSCPAGRTTHGPAPCSLNWNAPPDYRRTLPPFGVVTLPRSVTDVDVWVPARSVRGKDSRARRLRQTLDPLGAKVGVRQWLFSRARKPLAGHVPENRDVFNLTGQRLVVYGWAG